MESDKWGLSPLFFPQFPLKYASYASLKATEVKNNTFQIA